MKFYEETNKHKIKFQLIFIFCFHINYVILQVSTKLRYRDLPAVFTKIIENYIVPCFRTCSLLYCPTVIISLARGQICYQFSK